MSAIMSSEAMKIQNSVWVIWNKWPFLLCSLLLSFLISSRLNFFVMYNNDSLKKIKKSHLNMVDYFKELPFYNKHIGKPRVKSLKNIDLLSELAFYEELNVIKTNHAFRGYAMSYKAELVKNKRSN